MTAAIPPSAIFLARSAHGVLVVDDNPAHLYAVARGLRASGFRTVEAGSGAQALELSEFVSAVVLDVNLPDVDGLEVCRLLRAREATARLPIIHISAIRMDDEAREAASVAGADLFLVAPIDHLELAKALDALIADRIHIGLSRINASNDAQESGQPAGERSGTGAQSVLEQMTRRERLRDAGRE